MRRGDDMEAGILESGLPADDSNREVEGPAIGCGVGVATVTGGSVE